jgi:hypothetical protein
MTLLEFRDLLIAFGTEAGISVSHNFADGQTGNYIVWAEDREGAALYADDRKIFQGIQGTIDYFTKDEFDPVFNRIQEALEFADLIWRLNSTQYEPDTGYTHYEWVWEVDGVGQV